MDKPNSLNDIKSGRMNKEIYVKNNYPEFYSFINDKYKDLPFIEKLYWFYNGLDKHPVCPICGSPTKFISNSKGYAKHCSYKCTQNDKNVRTKLDNTKKELYGDDYRKVIAKKGRDTKLEKYGDSNYNNQEKIRKTCLEKYGVDNPQKSKEIRKKSEDTCLEKYGSKYYFTSKEFLNKKLEFLSKSKETCLERYGVDSVMKLDYIKDKVNKTCLEKYGVKWNCLRNEAHNSRNTKSCKNEEFANLLEVNNIKYSREFYLEGYSFDFKVNNSLIEIDPSATHNINWNPFSKTRIIDKDYHLRKSIIAMNNGFNCIHVWDWDNIQAIIDLLLDKKKIYARTCDIKEITKKKADEFINKNHIQKTVKGQTVRIALIKDNEILQVMTFGKPRYNKNYQYELIRLCSKSGVNVIGGASKLFNYFIKKYNPESIISYCDKSKFDGKIYDNLKMKLINESSPSCNWINVKTQRRITDSELRRLGADKLIGTNYGKGTSNSEIMLKNNYIQVYDCGQKTFAWNKDITI